MNEDIKKLINDACNQIKPIKIKQIIFNDDGLEEVKEVEYATVNERLKAYRKVFPTGQISTKLENLENDKEYITIKAHVMDDNFKVLATGYAREKLTEDGLEKCETSAILSADEIIKKYMLDIKSMEQKATYKGRYAGTYDLLTNDKDLIDIKTTSKLHKDYLAVQLGLYYMMLGIKKEYGYCMWIPKNQKAQFVIIKCWNYEECEDLLNRYEQSIAKQERVSDNSKHTMLTQASLF